MHSPRRRVAAPPRLLRGYSVETSRGAAAAATRTFRGDELRRRRGCHVDIPHVTAGIPTSRSSRPAERARRRTAAVAPAGRAAHERVRRQEKATRDAAPRPPSLPTSDDDRRNTLSLVKSSHCRRRLSPLWPCPTTPVLAASRRLDATRRDVESDRGSALSWWKLLRRASRATKGVCKFKARPATRLELIIMHARPSTRRAGSGQRSRRVVHASPHCARCG